MNRLAKLAWSPTVAAAGRRSFSALQTYKTSTGIVGLAVDPHGRENLAKISQQILDEVKVSADFQSISSIASIFTRFCEGCSRDKSVPN
jgi:hypothetical protein